MFLGNINEVKAIKWLKNLHTETLDKEAVKFKSMNFEVPFLIRALFFLLFGFLMKAEEILNLQTLPWAVVIVLLVHVIRWFTLRSLSLQLFPLLFIAPRGLITILIFISIPAEAVVPIINKSLIIQTIVLSAIFMSVGFMAEKQTVRVE